MPIWIHMQAFLISLPYGYLFLLKYQMDIMVCFIWIIPRDHITFLFIVMVNNLLPRFLHKVQPYRFNVGFFKVKFCLQFPQYRPKRW